MVRPLHYFATALLALALPAVAQTSAMTSAGAMTGAKTGQPIAQRFNADPSPHYFTMQGGGRFYLYATDDASNSGKYWDSTSWRLYTSTDMATWQDAGIPLDVKVFRWARTGAKAWAPEAVQRNGRFYFYAPVGGDRIGVAVSNRPDGGFADARSTPLVDKARDANAGDEPIDPAVFVDTDGQAWLYFGTRVPKVVKLKADMITLDGPIRDVQLTGLPAADPKKVYGEAPFLHERNGTYYFTFSTGWPGQIVYATGTSPAGPFAYRGVVLDYLKISTNHQAILEHEGQSWLFYHDSLLPGGGSHRRSIAIAPLEYEADGRIRQVPL
ncbi:MAG TPA: family 43 glycosylhydrolase, partial [Pseudoduganella sp.]